MRDALSGAALSLTRIVAHIETETDKAIDKIVASSPRRTSKSAVISELLAEAIKRRPSTK